MNLGEVYRFEVWYRLHQRSTLVYAFVLFAVPFLLMHAIDGSSLPLNAPVMVMNGGTIVGAIAMLVTAGIFGDAATRDEQLRMHSLFHTSPLKPSQYLTGRFLGSLTVNGALLQGVPLGLLLASVMPYMSAGKFGPVQLLAYVQMYVLLLLPNLVIIGVCMFAAAALSRHPLATYLGGLALYVLGTVAGDLTDGLSNLVLSALVDPFGGRAIAMATQLWTPAESATRLIGWPGVLLLNRAVWMAIAVGIVAALVSRFRFQHRSGSALKRWRRRREVVDPAPERIELIGVASAGVPSGAGKRSFTLAAQGRQILVVAGHMWREIAATRVFLVLMAASLGFVFLMG